MAYTTYYVVGPSSGWSDPTATEIKAGQLSGGGAATASGSEASLGSSGTHTFASPASGLSANTLYKTAYVVSDGTTNSSVAVSAAWQSVTIAPANGAITVAGHTPGISQPRTLAPAKGGYVVLGHTPGISQGVSIAPDKGAITVTGHTPGISQPRTLAPAKGGYVVLGHIPGISQAAILSPATGQIVVTGHVPGISQPRTLAPAKGGYVVLGHTPGISQSATSTTAPSYRTLQIVREIRALTIQHENRSLLL